MIRAYLERAISPSLGTCYRCRRPWKCPATRSYWYESGAWPLRRHRLPRPGVARISHQLGRDRFFGLIGVDKHSTEYEPGRACFPLCEGCWRECDLLQRMAYYERLCNDWLRDGLLYGDGYIEDTERKRPLIRAAVKAGL